MRGYHQTSRWNRPCNGIVMYWESTATPRRTLCSWKTTKANNSRLPIVTNSSRHKGRLDDLLKHTTSWINSEWEEKPPWIWLSFSLCSYSLLKWACTCFPRSLYSFPYWLGTQESRVTPPPVMRPLFKYLALNGIVKTAQGAKSERTG